MRSWENRPDCTVVDEPLYAYYLVMTGSEHPGRDEVIATGETSWQAVVADLTGPVQGVRYQKHMAHHLIPQLPRGWINSLTNVVLIRDPEEVVASYLRVRGAVAEEDIGLECQNELYEQLGGEAPVIDSADFLRDPETYLRWLCDHVQVEFTESMLRWPAGPRDSDGVWARYWYDDVIASTGFAPYGRRRVELPAASLATVERSRAYYDRLHSVRLVL
jgi:hypothetical protein